MRVGIVLGAVIAAVVLGSSAPVTAGPPGSRPMLAPEGWMFATVQPWTTSGDQMQVLAISTEGQVELVASVADVTAGLPDEARLDDEMTPRVSVDGFLALPITVRGEDDLPDGHVIRILDLQAPDPMATAWDLHLGPNGNRYAGAMAFGPDGRLSVGLSGRQGTVPVVIVVDPLERTRQELLVDRGWYAMTWLADASGWGSARSATTIDGQGRALPRNKPLPLLDLAGGAEQRSVDGRGLGTYDIGARTLPIAGEGQAFAIQPYGPSEPCGYDFRATKSRVRFTRGTIVYKDCVDDELLDIRWDVDGRDVLLLQDARGFVTLTRRKIGGHDQQLARFPVTALGLGRVPTNQLVTRVDGLAAGPRSRELLLAMRPSRYGQEPGPLSFFSTVERRVIRVPVDDDERAAFAGFSVPPIDREVAGLVPFVLADRPTPDAMVAPDGWMLIARPSRPVAGGYLDLAIVAISPRGVTREVALLEDVDEGVRGWNLDDLEGMAVTATGGLPVAFSPGSFDDGDPVVVRVFDLHDPHAAPVEIADTPERLHDWTTLRSDRDGNLSVRVDDPATEDDPILEIDLAHGVDRYLRFDPSLQVAPDPLRSGLGFPAWRDEHGGVLLRTDGSFATGRSRLVSLARGAEQQSARGEQLGRLVALQRPGDADCQTDAVVSGPIDGPLRVWWDVCRDRGTLLDHRWDVDGRGLLFLVQRGRRIELLRSNVPGRQEVVASFPARALGGPEPIDRRVGLAALMEGPRPTELLLAIPTARGLWFWSTLEARPVLALPAKGSGATRFVGFSVPLGDPR